MPHPQRNNVVELQSDQFPVRFGKPVDEQQIRLLLLLGHFENSIFKCNLQKVDSVVKRMLFTPWLSPQDTGLRGCFGVIGPEGGTLEALTMIAVSSQWYTDESHLEEYIVYVHPEHRTKGHGGRLIDWMIELAERMQIPLLTGVISQSRMEAKVRMYRKKLTPVGQFFLHMPKSNPYWESQRARWSSLPSSSAAA